MNRKAKEIINAEKRGRTGILDFYNCPLDYWPDEIFEMTWLKVLKNGTSTVRKFPKKREPEGV
ncbi:MAG: hypothetical protein AAGA77_19145 [Bacteroidota bacterium]